MTRRFLVAAGLFVLASCAKPPLDPTRSSTVRVLMEPDGRGAWRDLIAEFTRRHPELRIEMIEGPAATDSREDLYSNALLAGSQDYDLIFADTVWIPKFAAAGWLEDLTERWTAEEWSDFVPASLEGGSYQGKIYRVPVQLNGGILYYRKDLLAGRPPPRTFAELETLCTELAIPGQRSGYVWQGKQYEGLVCNFLEILHGFGGFWIEKNEVGLDRPEAVGALEFLRKTVGTISPAGVTTYAEEESRLLFQSGGAVFLRNWPYVARLIPLEKPDLDFGLAPLPSEPGRSPAATFGGAGFAIAKNSPSREAAWKFIEFVSSPWAVDFMQKRSGLQPARKSFYEKTTDPLQEQLYEVLKFTIPRPMIPQYAQASDILQRHVSAALTGQTTPDTAMKSAAAETRALLGRQP